MFVKCLKPVSSPWGSALVGDAIEVPDEVGAAWIADEVAEAFVPVPEPEPLPALEEQLAAVTAERDALAAEIAALKAAASPTPAAPKAVAKAKK